MPGPDLAALARLLVLGAGVHHTKTFRFLPWEDGSTYVQVTEIGLRGNGDEVVAHVAGSTGGFYQALCAAEALLEHGMALNVVRDQGLVHRSPPNGLDL